MVPEPAEGWVGRWLEDEREKGGRREVEGTKKTEGPHSGLDPEAPSARINI